MSAVIRSGRADRLWDAMACLALIAAVTLLYRKVLRLWWTYDDAFHLHLVRSYSTAAILFERDFWQKLPNKVFTPLLFLSVKADWMLSGADARRFYLHHLFSFALLAVVIYLVARLWLGPVSALFVAILAILGPPMCEIAEQLFHRHYLEGLIFATLSVGLFVKAVRDGKSGLWSAIAYFVAMIAKEVYVPLIVILFAIPERDLRTRARRIVPHCIALMVYVIWRVAMIGPAVQPYGLTARSGEWPRILITLPWRAVQRLGGAGDLERLLFLSLLGACVVFTFVRFRAMRPLIAVMAFAALAPIGPVAMQMETRFVLVLWILAVAAAAAAPRAVLSLLLIAAIFANRAEWSTTFRKTERMAHEARFFAQMKRGETLCNPHIPPGAIGELAWLTKSAAAWSYDDLGVCNGKIPGRLFAWYEPLRVVRPRAFPFVQRVTCREIVAMPVNASFDINPGTVFWRLGPYRDGTYALVLGEGSSAFDVPRDAGFRIGKTPGFPVRVRYTSPSGWMTYSPETLLEWRR